MSRARAPNLPQPTRHGVIVSPSGCGCAVRLHCKQPCTPCCRFPSESCMTHWPSLSWPGVVTATSLVVITLLSAVFVWQPPGDFDGWQVNYALIPLYCALEGFVLATSDDWNRLVYNKQAAMRALSSLRAWRRLKQSSLLQAARKPASAHKDADSPAPDHIDARLCPYTSFIPGVAPTSTPVSQRRAFWASIVLQVLVGPCVCYGLLKSRALPLGPSGVGLLLVVSAPSFQWLSFSLWGAAHHGNTVLLSLLECGSYAVTPFIASLTMALQLRFDADYAGVRVAPLVLVTFTLVSVPFIAALVFGSLCMRPTQSTILRTSVASLRALVTQASSLCVIAQHVLLAASILVLIAKDAPAISASRSAYPSLRSMLWYSILPSSLAVSGCVCVVGVILSTASTLLLGLSVSDWRSMCLHASSRSLPYIIAFALSLSSNSEFGHARGLVIFPGLIHFGVHHGLSLVTSFCVFKSRLQSVGSVKVGTSSSRNPLLNFNAPPAWSVEEHLPSPRDPKAPEHGFGDGVKAGSSAARYRDLISQASAIARSGNEETKSSGSRRQLHVPFHEPVVAGAEPSSDGPHWTSAIDPRSGNVYYFNRVTGDVSWMAPVGFVEITDWIQLTAANGRPYFYSRTLNKTVWRQPPGFTPLSAAGVPVPQPAPTTPAFTVELEPAGTISAKKRVHFGEPTQASVDMIDDRMRRARSNSVKSSDSETSNSNPTSAAASPIPPEDTSIAVESSPHDEHIGNTAALMMEARQRAAVDATAKQRDKAFFAEMKRAKEEEERKKSEEKLAALKPEERAEFERQEKEAREREIKKAQLLQRSLGGYGKKAYGGRAVGIGGRHGGASAAGNSSSST